MSAALHHSRDVGPAQYETQRSGQPRWLSRRGVAYGVRAARRGAGGAGPRCSGAADGLPVGGRPEDHRPYATCSL